MKYLIYMSTSVRLFGEDDLQRLLRKCQAKNALNGLTGMLLYSSGSFVQVLEGAGEDVDNTYAIILKDKRHKNIIKLAEGILEARNFPTWGMGFKVVSPDIISKFDAYINPLNNDVLKNGEKHPAITILKSFISVNDF